MRLKKNEDEFDASIGSDLDDQGELKTLSLDLDDVRSVVVDMEKDGSGETSVHDGAGDLTLTANDDGTFTVKTDYDETPENNRDETFESITEAIDSLKEEANIDTSYLDDIVKDEYGDMDDSIDTFVSSLSDLVPSEDIESMEEDLDNDIMDSILPSIDEYMDDWKENNDDTNESQDRGIEYHQDSEDNPNDFDDFKDEFDADDSDDAEDDFDDWNFGDSVD